jgi:hypothetical protein
MLGTPPLSPYTYLSRVVEEAGRTGRGAASRRIIRRRTAAYTHVYRLKSALVMGV